jgi:hypothetical protein
LEVFLAVRGRLKKITAFPRKISQELFFVFSGEFGNDGVAGRSQGV